MTTATKSALLILLLIALWGITFFWMHHLTRTVSPALLLQCGGAAVLVVVAGFLSYELLGLRGLLWITAWLIAFLAFPYL